jgi:hypothetical protein
MSTFHTSACAEASDTIICDPAFGESGRSGSPNQRKKTRKKKERRLETNINMPVLTIIMRNMLELTFSNCEITMKSLTQKYL